MTTTEWARSTISVLARSGDVLANVDVPGETLEAQLTAAEALLGQLDAGKFDDFGGVRLYCSWTPASGKYAMTLPESLLRRLGEAGGTFWLDAYPPEDAREAT